MEEEKERREKDEEEISPSNVQFLNPTMDLGNYAATESGIIMYTKYCPGEHVLYLIILTVTVFQLILQYLALKTFTVSWWSSKHLYKGGSVCFLGVRAPTGGR